MRMFVALAALMVSASAFAGGLTLKEIQAHHGQYEVDAPGALFLNSNNDALGAVYKRFLSLDGKAQVCVIGNIVYAGVTDSCVKRDENASDNQQPKCVATEKNLLYAPITGTKKVCVQYRDQDSTECVKTQEISYNLTKNLVAKIYRKGQRDDDRQFSNKGLVGTIRFALPACHKQPEGL